MSPPSVRLAGALVSVSATSETGENRHARRDFLHPRQVTESLGIVPTGTPSPGALAAALHQRRGAERRSEEHTSELQSRLHLVCRLLLEKKKPTTAFLSFVRAKCGQGVL